MQVSVSKLCWLNCIRTVCLSEIGDVLSYILFMISAMTVLSDQVVLTILEVNRSFRFFSVSRWLINCDSGSRGYVTKTSLSSFFCFCFWNEKISKDDSSRFWKLYHTLLKGKLRFRKNTFASSSSWENKWNLVGITFFRSHFHKLVQKR